MAARALAGVGGGIMLSIAYVGLCRSANPDRYFGLYVFIQLGTAGADALGISAVAGGIRAERDLPAVRRRSRRHCCCSCHCFPQRMPEPRLSDPRPVPRFRPARVLALFAQGLYFLAPGAAWGYLERIGQTFQLSLSQIGFALGASTFAGIAGAIAVVLLGHASAARPRIADRHRPVDRRGVHADGWHGFAMRFFIAASLFNFAWNATFPYQMGVLAQLDRTGAVAILSLIVQLGGLAAGPLVASMLHPEKGYDAILFACIGCYVVSLLLFRASARLHE